MSYVNALNKNVVCWLPLEHKGRLKPKIINEVVSYSLTETTDVASSADASRNRGICCLSTCSINQIFTSPSFKGKS
jgi:hypothetical protein